MSTGEEYAPGAASGAEVRKEREKWTLVLVRELPLPRSKGMVIGFWIVTALFCLQMGSPAYFRVELSWAKLIGVAVLLGAVPAPLKEWAYDGFTIDLGSAASA